MKNCLYVLLVLITIACTSDDSNPIINPDTNGNGTNGTNVDVDLLSSIFNINWTSLPNYENQPIPNYIIKDNTPVSNIITDETAILGRVLFYDSNLSTNNTIACASCHKQEFAFSDVNNVSQGVDGTTGRHSMRLVNARFSIENKFFWDERANSLEQQTTMPIQDHIEMGFSGENGDLNFNDLITKLENINYYPELFTLAYGNDEITEIKIQNALAQFIRSIQSFDSKYDIGRINAPNDQVPFVNFTAEENQGKQLFQIPPNFDNQGIRIDGGVGCAGCHRAPEFDIDFNSKNNGVVGTADGMGTDFTVTRAPSLRDVVKANGESNGPFMHIGISNNFATVLEHYNSIVINGNTNLDPRLSPNGNGQQLNLTDEEKNALFAFIKTLAGSDIYSNEKWSDPFTE